jgi:hypothetical protein
MTDEPSWRTFSTTAGADADRTFEGVVCRRIFASEIGVPSSALVAPPGLKGIEVSPVHRNSDWISYQAKYTNTKGVPWQAFRHSVETAVAALRSGYYQLDCVYCYTNAIPGAGKGGARTKQQYQLDNLAETNGLKLVWRFGNQVLDAVRDLPVLGRYFSQDLSHLCDWQEWASSPTPDFLEAAPRFVGRRDELTQLRAFLEDDRPFTWWSLLGSGGSGKTRLVLELAEQVDPSWSVVWLMPHANAVLNNSQITGPTLVVIDGPLQFENGTLEGVVEKFSMREPPKKLRLIFLDRDERPWKRTLLAGEASRSRDTQYDEPLRLGRLDPDAWVDLVEQAAASAQIDRSELEARLGSAAMGEPEPAEGHGSSTPLEVLLAAHVGGAQLDESIRRYLDGKKKDYYPTATTELLALASAITVSGGLHAIDLPDRFKRVLEDPSDRSILSRVMGNGTDPVTNFIAPLRPDPIGEFFVLDHWESRGLLRVPDDLVTALGISSPWKVAEFFNRAAADFPAHEALRVLSHDPPADHDRTWALARMACAHRVLRHSRSLGRAITECCG